MVFGEIVEPSSRALLDDESKEYPEYEKPEYVWSGNHELLSNLETLVFIETKRINEFFQKFILQNETAICKLDHDIILYKKGSIFIALYEGSKNEDSLTSGQIVEVFGPYISKAKQIVTITSSPLITYQGELNREKSEYLVKSLYTKNSTSFGYDKLGTPNLITGLGGNVLSYCIYNNLECTSFIFYFTNAPIDSINCKPLIELTEKMSLSPSYYNVNMTAPSHNLYM